jgi:hypothetical protein
MMNFTLRNICIHTFQVIFTCLNILRRVADGFTSSPKEGVLWIFIAIKNPSPPLGKNP